MSLRSWQERKQARLKNYLEKARTYLQKPLSEWEQMYPVKFEHEFRELKLVCERIGSNTLAGYIKSVERLRPVQPQWTDFMITAPFHGFPQSCGSSLHVDGVAIRSRDDC